MDPLRKVRPGDSVRRSAGQINAMLAAAEEAKRSGANFGESDGPERGPAQVLIVAASTLDRFAPFALGTCVTTPATDSQFQNLPAFNSAAVTADKPFGIMIDPAYSGSTGRGILFGLAPALVTIVSATPAHEFVKINSSLALESATTGYARIIWAAGTSGSQWCLLALPAAAGGPANGTTTNQVLTWNDTTKVWEAGTLTQITFVTDMQVDTSGKLIQKKTRTAYVLSPGTESSWTTITGGTMVQGVTA